MGKFNRRGKAKKEHDFVALQRDIKYANDVPPEIAALVEVGIQQTLVKFNKTADNQQYGGNLAGGRSLAAMTLLTYESHYRGLTRFFKLIGDYESLLMLRDKRPKNCPSMRVESCIMYMWYKFRPVTTVLTNLAGEPVNNVTVVPIHCSRTWNDPGKRRQFAGALYCIHVASKQNGLYHEKCDKCCVLPVNERHKGCDSHAGSPLLLTSGSPQTDLTFINASEKIRNELSGYVSQPCGQLLPCNV